MRAVFAFPLHIGAIRVGALDLYRDRPGELGHERLSGALMAADAAALALLHLDLNDLDNLDHTAGTDADENPATQQLQVHQATGMVMVQCGVGPEEALLRLRGRAFAAGMDLTGLAREVVSRRVRLDEDE